MQNKEELDFICEWTTHKTILWNHFTTTAQVFLDPTGLQTADPPEQQDMKGEKDWKQKEGASLV